MFWNIANVISITNIDKLIEASATFIIWQWRWRTIRNEMLHVFVVFFHWITTMSERSIYKAILIDTKLILIYL